MDARVAVAAGDTGTATAAYRRSRQYVGSVRRVVRRMEDGMQRVPSGGTKRGTKGLAHMRLHVGGGARGDRQSVRLVEDDTVGGGVDGVPVVLGAVGDMLFVGSCTRLRTDEVQEEGAASVPIPGMFDRSRSNHHEQARRRGDDVDFRRDREDGSRGRGTRMVRGDDQGRRFRDKRYSVVIPSVGRP